MIRRRYGIYMKNEKIRKLLKRVFFYSSRQLTKRWRSYLSIFITSIVLLTLVMTFLEMADSLLLRDIDTSRTGTYHAVIRGMLNDYSEKIGEYRNVKKVYKIPYTSLLASSDDTTTPARVVVENDEIRSRLGVRYVWGCEPGDGEIAVSDDLYRAYDYLSAGQVNDLYFTGAEMAYFPLKISGIFTCSDRNAGYVFVNDKTAHKIDNETGAVTRYDIYINFKNKSDRYIAKELDKIMRGLNIPDTEWQSRKKIDDVDLIKWSILKQIFDDYMNKEYLSFMTMQYGTPTVLISMPVIIIAALMLASFVSNWMISNAPEYGVLGAIGANRRQLCAISAGQVLLISFAATIPVILLSALLSNLYISIFNSAVLTDVDYRFSIPWSKIIEAALWFDALSCYFTYLGINRMTREYPYTLISGSFKKPLPFVKETSWGIIKSKDRIAALSFVESLRQIKSGVITSVITSIICIVCTAFLILLVVSGVSAANKLTDYNSYSSDMRISSYHDTVYNRHTYITSETIDYLRSSEKTKTVSGFNIIQGGNISSNGRVTNIVLGDRQLNVRKMLAGDENILPLAYGNIIEGDPSEIFETENGVVLITDQNGKFAGNQFSVGEKVPISEIVWNNGSKTDYLNENTVTICAITTANTEFNDLNIPAPSIIISKETADSLGYTIPGKFDNVLCSFRDDIPKTELEAFVDEIQNSPFVIRYNVENFSVMSSGERQMSFANTMMLSLFIGMLYLAFCVMTYTDAFLKITKSRSGIAVMRQCGATDQKIYKTMRVGTYPVSFLALILTITLTLLVFVGYTLYSTSQLNIMADRFPLTYTKAYFSECRAKIWREAGIIALLGLSSLPMIFISFGVRIAGTLLPTKRILAESITTGLRKDTD